ncbi:sulfotransferase [Pectinatus brassicae]|uniref:Sulfotransferase domain-containing protein n=1 Tax=Pectinatus brassicae TaxID=862415 RepID=A0A840UIP5_9FIRM|nr:sulfotransferase domain-containing protein [Pectinatus brassicae]MBB5336849.1 hypothetical protein [Pectinatus brassicae]
MYKKIVALYGVPRSGTSWVGEILDSCPKVIYKFQPLFSYAFKNYIKPESKESDINKFFHELYNKKDDFLDQKDKREKGTYPRFENKNEKPDVLVYKEARYLYTIPIILKLIDNIKMIFIVRNPYDTLESWINAPLEYNAQWNIQDEWEFAQSKNEFLPENYYGYYKWKESIMLFSKMKQLYPNKVKIINYEKLEKQAEDVTKNMFSFLEFPYTGQTEEFLRLSQSKSVDDPYGVYRKKGEIRKRRIYLPADIKLKIEKDLEKFFEYQQLNKIV